MSEVDEGAGEGVGDAVRGDVWMVVLLVLRFLWTKRGRWGSGCNPLVGN